MTTTIAQQRARRFIQNTVAILLAIIAIVAIFLFIRSRTEPDPTVVSHGVTAVEPAPAPVQIVPSEILFEDQFEVARNSWETSDVQVGYQGGAFILNDSQFEDYAWARPHLEFDDFIVEVYTRWIGGAVGGAFGIDFRLQEGRDDYYAFYIHNDGRYTIGRNIAGTWTEITEAFSPAIERHGGVNLLRVETQGSRLRFFVNNVYLVDVTDDNLAEGDIRLVSRKVTGTESLVVAFDNFVVARNVSGLVSIPNR